MTTNIYIIRHGESFSNVDGVIGGIKTDRGLTERGFAQARALAARLATGEIPADVLYASTLLRARQTAELVAEALKLPIAWDDDLHELRPGDSDGLHVNEARDRYEGFARFLEDLYTPIAPGAESWGTFQTRVSAALERLIRRHTGQSVVLVAHGGVIEVSFLHFLGLGPEARTRAAFHGRNTSITHWRHQESVGRLEWRLLAHNDHYHLRALDGDTRQAPS
ncbi:MAG TPA: histidine phosphatase family protein [Roseiflexaceae bacterium]|nr:histidine phosphatase family protein [Roseiflexaceae bacterium]